MWSFMYMPHQEDPTYPVRYRGMIGVITKIMPIERTNDLRGMKSWGWLALVHLVLRYSNSNVNNQYYELNVEALEISFIHMQTLRM